jgi:hypothetical protein
MKAVKVQLKMRDAGDAIQKAKSSKRRGWFMTKAMSEDYV